MHSRTSLQPNFIAIAPAFAIPAVCCLTLFVFLDGALDNKMYLFIFSLAVLLIFQVRNYDFTFRFGVPRFLSQRTVDYAIVICSSVTLISNYFDNPVQSVAILSSFVTILFVPGWVLLRILGISNKFNKRGHILVLTFAISIALNGIILTLMSFYEIINSPLLLAAIYWAVSLIPIFKQVFFRKSETYLDATPQLLLEYKVFDVLILIWILIFFFFTIGDFYPDISKSPGSDIVEHFSVSKGLLLAPDIYESTYPWYHFLLASLLQLSAAPMLIFQSVIACISFMLIFSFYIMARSYLTNIDRRAPVWSTVIFSVFAGFGWLYFFEKIPNPSDMVNYIQTMNLVSAGTYFDIGYSEGGWMWFWFRPVTLGIIIIFVILYFLTNQKLSKNKYILIDSLLLVALSHIHFAEFVLFVVFNFVVTIFIPKSPLRLKDTSSSIIIALVVYFLLIFSYPDVFSSAYFLPLLPITLGILSSISFILSRYTKRPFSSLRINIPYAYTIIVMISVLFIYLILLFHWFLDTENFDDYTSLMNLLTLYAVPWQFYPMLLGITGIFAIIGIPILVRKHKGQPVLIFVMIFILMICIGRLITFIGSEFTFAGYYERRTIFLVFTSASMLAPVGILAVMRHFSKSPRGAVSTKEHITTAAFISFLVIVGALSTFLSIEYRINYTEKYAVEDSRIEPVQKYINRYPYSTVLTVSPESNNIAKFSSPGYLIGYWSDQIWPSKSPELPLNIMSIFNSSFIYIQGNDSQLINDKYHNGYLNEHVLKVAPIVHENKSSKIIQLPKLSSPTKYTGNLVLVMPDLGNMSQLEYYAYDVLSLAGYNYTTALVSDIPSLRNARVVLAPSEYVASKIIQYKKEYDLQYEKLIVLNLDGYGKLWAELTELDSRNLAISSSVRLDTSNRGNENTIYKTKILNLPEKIVMIPYVPHGNVEQIASFENTNVPFILEKKGSDGLDIFYININPIVQVTSSANDKSGKIYTLLQSVLEYLPMLELPRYDSSKVRSPSSLTSGGVAAFDSVEFEGNLKVNSSSAIMGNIGGGSIELIIDGRKSVIENVSRLVPVSIQNLTVQGYRGGILEKGYGYYSLLNMNQPLIRTAGNPAVILVEANKHNEGETAIVTGKEILLNLSQSSILLRQPKVLSDGIANFTDFYAYGELYNKIPAVGQDVNIEGENSFDIDYSDEFTVISSASFNGKFLRGQLASPYDELGSLSNIFSFPYARHLLVLLVLLAVIAVYLLDKKASFQRESRCK